jgi:hypothetical protein
MSLASFAARPACSPKPGQRCRRRDHTAWSLSSELEKAPKSSRQCALLARHYGGYPLLLVLFGVYGMACKGLELGEVNTARHAPWTPPRSRSCLMAVWSSARSVLSPCSILPMSMSLARSEHRTPNLSGLLSFGADIVGTESQRNVTKCKVVLGVNLLISTNSLTTMLEYTWLDVETVQTPQLVQ